jgi:murein DD-endopeptidase MepM/ murein hydrolase activator NlpD
MLRSQPASALARLGRLPPFRHVTLAAGAAGMSVVLFSRDGRSRLLNVNLRHPLIVCCACALTLAALGGAFAIGVSLGQGRDLAARQTAHWMDVLRHQREQLADLNTRMQARAEALAIQVGDLQAHMIRLDALGRRLTAMAGLPANEFDFGENPALGGPDTDAPGAAFGMPSLARLLRRLKGRMELRTSQLSALENVLLSRKLKQEIYPEGRPVDVGWISSPFGWRIDPLTGRPEFHEGIDFAAPMGTPIHAVAAGVVTWAAPMEGYGNMVEINDGEGYSTLYAHSEKLLVHAGETVKRGEVIALVGSTGWSTGPHVHFQVMKDGHPINPKAFIGLHARTLAQALNSGHRTGT